MTKTVWILVFLTLGCATSQQDGLIGPLCGTCDVNTPAARSASRVKLTNDPDMVAGCQLLGQVNGWEDMAKQNGGYWLALAAGAYGGPKEPDIKVLFIRGGDDRAYWCGGSTRVRIIPDDSEAAGCTLLGVADETPCPESYAADRAKCLSWRAVRVRGNVIVDAPVPRIYRCMPGQS